MSELMKKTIKEAENLPPSDRLRLGGKTFVDKKEESCHQALKYLLGSPMRRSNIDVVFIQTGHDSTQTRVLKSAIELSRLSDEDQDVFKTSLLDKYKARPLSLESKCLMYFATNYVHAKSTDASVEEETTIDGFLKPVAGYIEKESTGNIITLLNGMKMRQRSRECVGRYHHISKAKNPEDYYMVLLQLYHPWRVSDDLVGEDGTYMSKFIEVEHTIDPVIRHYEPYDEINEEDLERAALYISDEEVEPEELEGDDLSAFLNPRNIDINLDDADIDFTSTQPSSVVRNNHMDNLIYYKMCEQLNTEQRFIFNYVMKHTQQVLHNFKNDLESPEPFYIFLSGGGGVGKSRVIAVIDEYLKRHLKFKNQLEHQPSVAVCASTGVAAINIGGTTLHTAFGIKINGRSQNLANEELHKKQIKYEHLQVVITDELSMTSYPVWDIFERRLRECKGNKKRYGGVSVIASGDFYQLPPAGWGNDSKYVFENVSTSYDVLSGHKYKDHFLLVELQEIVRQGDDPAFAEVLSRVRLGEQTVADIKFLEQMQCSCCKKSCKKCKCNCICSCVSHWPVQPIHLFFSNHLKDAHNQHVMKAMGDEIHSIHAFDSSKDENTKQLDLSNIVMSNRLNLTGNLPNVLRICIGARVIITYNINLSDRLVNGTMGIVKGISLPPSNPMEGIIYVLLDDPLAGNSIKVKSGDLKGTVCIKAHVQDFQLRYGSSVKITRKQFPLTAAHGVTIHKSQGQTYDYMVADFCQNTESGKGSMPINPGAAYTAISRGKQSKNVLIRNFDPSIIKANPIVTEEMKRLRQHKLLRSVWQDPLQTKGNFKLVLYNIRSFNLHLSHFLSELRHLQNCDLFAFTETNIRGTPEISIKDFSTQWECIHETSEHGLCLCYNTSTVQVVQKLNNVTDLEILKLVLDLKGYKLVLIILYKKPSISSFSFLEKLTQEMEALPCDYRRVIAGDFNCDLLEEGNCTLINSFCSRFGFVQVVDFSTHNLGGILDLILDTEGVRGQYDWLPSVFSDHFLMYYDINL